jgi:type I restriction enzyme S subunit
VVEKKAPEIRFAGFTDDWEQRKALEVFERRDERGFSGLPVLSATQEDGMVDRARSGRYVEHDTMNEAGYKHVIPGDFVIHLRSFQGGFAHSPLEGITSPAYTVFVARTKSLQYQWFWKYVFASDRFIKSLKNVTYGIRDGRSINVDEFFDGYVWFPCFDEQKEIGDLFNKTSELITLHQRSSFL